MNVKIKSAGVACLIGEDYDRVYATLKKIWLEVMSNCLPKELLDMSICNGSFRGKGGAHFRIVTLLWRMWCDRNGYDVSRWFMIGLAGIRIWHSGFYLYQMRVMFIIR